MAHSISAMELRKQMGHILNRVDLTHEPIIITRADRPIAVLIDVETFNQNRAVVKSSQPSVRDFTDSVHLDLTQYRFNREEANER